MEGEEEAGALECTVVPSLRWRRLAGEQGKGRPSWF